MAKFSGSTVAPGQVSELQKQSIIQTPTEAIQEVTPQASPAAPAPAQEGSRFQQRLAASQNVTPEETLAAVGEGVEAGLAVEDQIAAERIPTLKERAADTGAVHVWSPRAAAEASSTPKADGGLKARAATMAQVFGGPDPATKLGLTPTSAESRVAAQEGDTQAVAALEADTQTGSLIAALNRSGSVRSWQDPNTRAWSNEVDPMMLQVGSAVTENMMADAAFGETAEGLEAIDPNNPAPTVSKAQNNAMLGREIHREYSRMKNSAEGRQTDDYTDLSQEESTTLGDAFKEMWAIANPTLVNRDQAGDQVVFQLTPEGVEALKKGAVDRKRLFPKTNVRPAKTPPPKGQLPGEVGRTATKRKTGRVKQPLVGAKTLTQATENLSEVPNVVDRQREKILYLTILPVLGGQLDHTSWQAEINNIGTSKMQGFVAAENAYLRKVQEGDTKTQPYSAVDEMDSLQNTIAQEVRAIATERNGANYLTYTVQAFNGRIAPQQTYFDPTSSKAVRFVTRNAVPAKATPGSRIARNLEQMYAMMLVKGADSLLPEGRLTAFQDASPQLEAWGTRLNQVLNESMTDAQLDAVAEAIQNGVSINDPNFPQVAGLALDTQADADLINAITSKGEDGPHFIDGLIDAAKYIKAKREGRPHHSYFNAYVDGKTNGIASNGIQMGSEQVARATGVLRNNTNQLLDEGDIRDQLKTNLLQRLENDGFGGTVENDGALYEVARNVFSYRNLNKATTMTFSYGKELESFIEDINETLDLLYADGDPAYVAAVDAMDKEMGREVLAESLLNFYVGSLAEVLSEEALETRQLMRSAAMLHAMSNQLFSITGPTGFQLNFGGEATLGFDADTATTYSITQDGRRQKVTAGQYRTESTAAAVKVSYDEEGNVQKSPGQEAYGGSVPGPVQSLDAATVARSVTGRSWDKLKAASNGNPYMHTIYDAFKFDAMGFDVGVAEVNNNWLDSSMNWSYLEETYAATQDAMAKWSEEMQQKPQGELVDISMAGPYRMMGWMLEPQETQSGKQFPTRLYNRLSKILGTDKTEEDVKEAAQRILQKVKASGVNIYDKPDKVTVRQLRIFMNAMAAELDLKRRMGAMINKTNANKKKLKKKIDAQKRLHGNEVLQYYAH